MEETETRDDCLELSLRLPRHPSLRSAAPRNDSSAL
jgi:hypothetical protein